MSESSNYLIDIMTHFLCSAKIKFIQFHFHFERVFILILSTIFESASPPKGDNSRSVNNVKSVVCWKPSTNKSASESDPKSFNKDNADRYLNVQCKILKCNASSLSNASEYDRTVKYSMKVKESYCQSGRIRKSVKVEVVVDDLDDLCLWLFIAFSVG